MKMESFSFLTSLLLITFITSVSGKWWDTDGLVLTTFIKNRTAHRCCASGVPNSEGYVEVLPAAGMRLVNWFNATSLDSHFPDMPLAVLINEKRISAFPPHSQPVLFILNAQDPDIRLIKPDVDEDLSHAILDSGDFDTLLKVASSSPASQTSVEIFRDIKIESRLDVFNPAALLVYGIALLTIMLGSLMVMLSAENLLSGMREMYANFEGSKMAVYVALVVILILTVGLLLFYYFMYDIAVYFAIALFFCMGALSITNVLAFWVTFWKPRTKKSLHFEFSICTLPIKFGVSILKLCLLPIGVSVMIVWVVFRNDEFIGWHIQSAVGVVLIAWLLSSTIPLPSLKLITICFTMFLIYDVFFVFITPLFKSQSTTPTPPANVVHRSRRSLGGELSYMEAIATGAAGTSGELLPASFRVHIVVPSGEYGCKHSAYSVLLGFGDALIPGLLCTFLAFYDTLWKVRIRINFAASIFGYMLGLLMTQFVLSLTQRGQPALLYLCPCTLLVTVLATSMFQGKDELLRLWKGAVPLPSEPEDSPDMPKMDRLPSVGTGKSTELLYPVERDTLPNSDAPTA